MVNYCVRSDNVIEVRTRRLQRPREISRGQCPCYPIGRVRCSLGTCNRKHDKCGGSYSLHNVQPPHHIHSLVHNKNCSLLQHGGLKNKRRIISKTNVTNAWANNLPQSSGSSRRRLFSRSSDSRMDISVNYRYQVSGPRSLAISVWNYQSLSVIAGAETNKRLSVLGR